MTGTARFVCSDPDAGDFEFADVEAVLDGLEAALLQPGTPIFDAARQSWQPVGLHPEIRARLGGSPPLPAALRRRAGPSRAALDHRDRAESARGRRGRVGPPTRSLCPDPRPRSRVEVRTLPGTARRASPPSASLWALLLLAVVGWVVVKFAARLSEFAAAAVGMKGSR